MVNNLGEMDKEDYFYVQLKLLSANNFKNALCERFSVNSVNSVNC